MLRRRSFRFLVGVAGALVVAGVLAWAVSAVAWRRYQVWAALPVENALSEARDPGSTTWDPGAQERRVARNLAGPDPWGRSWSDGPSPGPRRPPRVWSKGPDGVDEGGQGDDVPVDGAMELVALAPLLGTLAALGVLWLALVVRSLGGGRGPEAWHDAVRAAVATSPAAALLGLLLAGARLPPVLRRMEGLVVPPHVAIAGAAWLVLALVVLAWRARPSNPRRRQVRHGRVALGCAAALVAAGAASHGLLTWTREQPERALRLRAELGQRGPVELVLSGDLPEMEAYLARDPQVEWHRLGPAAHRGVARLGPAANRSLALALRWSGGVSLLKEDPWRHLLTHDEDLEVLKAALAAEPERYPALLLERPALVAGLLGAPRALDGLRVLAGRTAFEGTDGGPGLSSDEAASTGARAREAIQAVTADDDVWLLISVRGLTPTPEGELRCGARLFGPETLWTTHPRDGRILAALGPLPAWPAGRTLHLRESGVTRKLVLPALTPGTSLWVDALMGPSGRLALRPIARPE